MSIVAVLYLPESSHSVTARIYEEEIAGTPLLTWFCRELGTMPGVKDVVVIVSSAAENERVLRLLDHTVAKAFVCGEGSISRCLAAFVLEECVPRIAVVKYPLALAPRQLLARTLIHHKEAGNEVTEVVGIPAGIAPIIFEAEALLRIAALRAPGAPVDPLHIYHRIRGLGSAAVAQLGLTGTSVSFDAGAIYGHHDVILPYSVAMSTLDQVKTCRRVLARVESIDNDDTSTLRIWREEQYWDRVKWARGAAINACRMMPARDGRARVLYVSNPSVTAGAEQSLLQMIGCLDTERFDLAALVGAEGVFTERLRGLGVTVICPGSDFSEDTPDNYVFAAEVLRLVDPSVIHLNAPSGNAIIAAAAERGCPQIFHLRNRPTHEYVDMLAYSAAVIVVSLFIKSELLQFGVPEDRIHVIHNGISAADFSRQRFDRGAIRKALGFDDDVKVILAVARIVPYKRYDLLVEAFARIRVVFPTARVVALGEALEEREYAQCLRERIKEMGLQDAFTFLPFQKDVRPFYVAADCFVLCSDGEPLGRCIIEALSMEAPIVATDSGGTTEIIKHQETGLLARSGDAVDLATCVVSTLVHSSESSARTRAGRRFVKESLSARVVAEKTMLVYDQCGCHRD